ncbi:hypothetical protein [Caulobacter sp. CCUG 60055]|nr:hypothetical protein [Caulobacter sp. CCUG 60055]MBQ1543612.1 hypothetical protein [Caulobacteraceae bacterium]
MRERHHRKPQRPVAYLALLAAAALVAAGAGLSIIGHAENQPPGATIPGR